MMYALCLAVIALEISGCNTTLTVLVVIFLLYKVLKVQL